MNRIVETYQCHSCSRIYVVHVRVRLLCLSIRMVFGCHGGINRFMKIFNFQYYLPYGAPTFRYMGRDDFTTLIAILYCLQAKHFAEFCVQFLIHSRKGGELKTK